MSIHLRHLFIGLCLTASQHGLAQTVWPDAEWQRATPEEAGMDSRALAALVEYGANAKMDSLVVVRHGKIVAEAYYAPFAQGMKHRVNSATKGVVAALTGIAIDKGLLPAPGTLLTDLFADRSMAGLDARKKQITLQHVLDMTSGIQWAEPLVEGAVPQELIAMERSRDWVQYVLDRPMATDPGATFNYSSGNSQLLSELIARRTGMDTQDYAAQELFKPLGIRDFRWRRDAQGRSIGGWGLYLHTRDMARIGLLYLHRGQWKDQQVVPAAWVDKVFNATVPMSPGGAWRYADQWWSRPDHKASMAVGQFRQLIIAMPELGVVVATTGREHYPIEDLVDHVTRAAKSAAALAPSPEGQALLAARVAEAAIEKASAPGVPPPALAALISGKTFTLGRNEWGFVSFTLHLDGNGPAAYDMVRYVSRTSNATREFKRPLGTDGRFAMVTDAEGLVGSKARWIDGRTLAITVRLPEEILALDYELKFDGTQVEFTGPGRPGQRLTVTGSMQ
jgi:CubicO group peptidase (beta-lactamase class C family)